MGPFTSRIFGYVCLSFSLALLLGPFSGKQLVQADKQLVRVSSIEITTSPYPAGCSDIPPPVRELSPKVLAKYPQLEASLKRLSASVPVLADVPLYGGNILSLLRNELNTSSNEVCFSMQGRTFRLTRLHYGDFGRIALVAVTPDSIRRVGAEAELSRLDQLSELGRVVQAAPGNMPVQVPLAQWDRLGGAVLSTSGTPPLSPLTLRLDNRILVRDATATVGQQWSRVGWLDPARYLIGAVLLLLGQVLLVSNYWPKPYISSSSGWLALAIDSVFVVCLAVGGFCIADWLLQVVAGLQPSLSDTMLQSLAGMCYLPMLLFAAWYGANFYAQGVRVVPNGILLYLPGKNVRLPWHRITGFSLTKAPLPWSPLCSNIGNPLCGRLLVHLPDGPVSVIIPHAHQARERFMNQLRAHAPLPLGKDLLKVTAAILSRGR